MYQNLVSNAPTPVVLANQVFSQTSGSLSTVGYSISTTGSYGVFNFTDVSLSRSYNGVFVQARKLGRTVFGAKYSVSCSSPLTPLWCVIDMTTTSGSGTTASLSGVTFYPFSSSSDCGGSDTLTVNSTPTDPSHCVYVGVVFVAGSDSPVSALGSVSIAQYVGQESFLQPLKG